MRFGGHTHFVTVGQAIGTPAAPVPDLRPRLDPDRAARRCSSTGPLTQTPAPARGAFTTVGNWRGYGSVEHEASALRAEGPLDAGADVHPDPHRRRPAPGPRRPSRRDTRPRGARPQRMAAARPRDCRRTTRTPTARSSPARRPSSASQRAATCSRAAAGSAIAARAISHPAGRCWRRTPASRIILPTGEGLLAFNDVEDAVAAIEEIRGGYQRHAGAARALAEEHLDSDRVLDPAAGPGGRHMSNVDESHGSRTTEVRAALERALSDRRGATGVDREPGSPPVRLPDQLRARGARRRARGRHATCG